MKKQLKAAQSIAKVMKEYSMTLPKLKGRAIPLEIYLQTKNHKILVATTATKKKESKKN